MVLRMPWLVMFDERYDRISDRNSFSSCFVPPFVVMGSMHGVSKDERRIDHRAYRVALKINSSHLYLESQRDQCVEGGLCLMPSQDLHHHGTMVERSTTVALSFVVTRILCRLIAPNLLQSHLLSFVNPHSLSTLLLCHSITCFCTSLIFV